MLNLRKNTSLSSESGMNGRFLQAYIFDKIYQNSDGYNIRNGNFVFLSNITDEQGNLLIDNSEFQTALQGLLKENLIFQSGIFVIGESGHLFLEPIFFCNAERSSPGNLPASPKEKSKILVEALEESYVISAKIVGEYFANARVSSTDLNQSILNILMDESREDTLQSSNLTFHPRTYFASMETTIPWIEANRTFFLSKFPKAMQKNQKTIYLGKDIWTVADLEKIHFLLFGLCVHVNKIFFPRLSDSELTAIGLQRRDRLFGFFTERTFDEFSIEEERLAIRQIVDQMKKLQLFLGEQESSGSDNFPRFNQVMNVLTQTCLSSIQKEESHLGSQMYQRMREMVSKSDHNLDLFFFLSEGDKDRLGKIAWKAMVENPEILQKIYFDKQGPQHILFLNNFQRLRKLIRQIAIQEIVPDSRVGFFIVDFLHHSAEEFKENIPDSLLKQDIYYCQRVLLRSHYSLYRRLLIWLLFQPRSDFLLEKAKKSMYDKQKKWEQFWLRQSKIEKNMKQQEAGQNSDFSLSIAGKKRELASEIMERIDYAYLKERRIPTVEEFLHHNNASNPADDKLIHSAPLQMLLKNKTLSVLHLPVKKNDLQSLSQSYSEASNRLLIYGRKQDLLEHKVEILLTIKKYLESEKNGIQHFRGLRLAKYLTEFLDAQEPMQDPAMDTAGLASQLSELINEIESWQNEKMIVKVK